MKKINFLLAAAIFFASCGGASTSSNSSTSASSPSVSNTPSTTPAADVPTPKKEAQELNLLGKLITVEEMDYPRGFITVKGDKGEVNINFDQENGKYKLAELNKLKKRQVNVMYKAEMAVSVVDMHSNGKTIFKDNANPILPEYKKASGTLTVGGPTLGDLPDEASLKTANGVIEFLFFVTEEMSAFNGKNVDIYYVETPNNELISIESLD